jgi:hypothetical protein
MTLRPETDTKAVREVQDALDAAGPFDVSYFEPEVLRAALEIASEWRRIMNADAILDDHNRR